MAIVTASLAALAQVFIASENAIRIARATSAGVLLATSKMEQLRASGRITPSPADALSKDTDGYVDYLDANGGVLEATFPRVPAGAVYVRRWAVNSMRTGPLHGSVLQVLVTRFHAGAGASPQGDVRLVSILPRGTD